MPLSSSPYLRIAASIFATIFLGFGINGILNPDKALEMFEFAAPSVLANQSLVYNLVLIYAIRVCFISSSIFAAALFGDRKVLGWIVVAASLVAFSDGFIVKAHAGHGEWNHWGYACFMLVNGTLLLGLLG